MKYFGIILLMLPGALFARQEPAKQYGLAECIEIALDKNLSVKLSRLDMESTGIDLFQSKMNRLPNLNFNGGYGFNWGRSIDPTTNDFINQQIKFSSFSGNSSVTLFNGLQLSNSIRRDQLNFEASQNNLEDTQNDIAVMVTTIYLDVIFNRELLQNALSQLEVTRKQLDQTTKLVDAGSLPITNKLELEAQIAGNEVEVVNTENSLNLSLLNLKQVLQIPASDDFDVVAPDIEVNTLDQILPPVADVYDLALSSQPEIKSADLQVESSILNLRVAKGALSPHLTLNGSIRTNFSDAANRQRTIFEGTTTREVPIGFLASDPNEAVNAILDVPNIVKVDPDFTFREQFDENLSKSLSLNLQIPVFNRWNTRNNMQRAKIGNKQAEINAEQVRNQLRQNIETAYNNATASLKSYQASSRQVDALERTFENVENRYSLGVVNFVDYQVASNNLFRARSDLTRAKYEYIFRLKILDFYQGKPLSFD